MPKVYAGNISDVANCTKLVFEVYKIDSNVWHKRLGHVSVSRMKLFPFMS